MLENSEAYSEPSERSKMVLLWEHSHWPLAVTIFAIETPSWMLDRVMNKSLELEDILTCILRKFYRILGVFLIYVLLILYSGVFLNLCTAVFIIISERGYLVVGVKYCSEKNIERQQ